MSASYHNGILAIASPLVKLRSNLSSRSRLNPRYSVYTLAHNRCLVYSNTHALYSRYPCPLLADLVIRDDSLEAPLGKCGDGERRVGGPGGAWDHRTVHNV